MPEHALSDRAVKDDLDIRMPWIGTNPVHYLSNSSMLAFKNLREPGTV